MRVATKAAARIAGSGPFIHLLHDPASEDRPRWGYGRPAHPRLAELLGRHADTYVSAIAMINSYERDLLAIAATQTSDLEPFWRNGFMFGLDAPSLYAFVRSRAPTRYVEIGSGNSTLFANRARRDGGLATQIVSIDPSPRRDIDAVCNGVIRQPLEDVDLGVFADLAHGDIVFLDGTHRVFMNSDVTAFFLDVLPSLATGVLVGVHDIHLPDDYRPEHALRYYSEQYLLAAYLLAECAWLRPVLPCWYVSHHDELGESARQLFGSERIPIGPHGVTFWMETCDRT